MPEPKSHMQLGVTFGALGALLTIGGLAISAPRFYLVATGSVAEGKVVDHKTSSKGGTRSIVEFKPKGKPRTRVTATVGNSPPLESLGETVQVYYDPAEPSDALIDSFSEKYFFIALLSGMGVLFMGIGAPSFFLGRARRAARDRVRREGVHAAGAVVAVQRQSNRNTLRFTPIVEAIDPLTGAVSRFSADERYEDVMVGRNATVHIESWPRHRYFVEV